MRKMLWFGAATVLMGGAVVAIWSKRVEIEVDVVVRESVKPAVPVAQPTMVVAAPTRMEADEPIVVERPEATTFTVLPETDVVPGVVQSHGQAQPPRPGDTTVPRMPEVVD